MINGVLIYVKKGDYAIIETNEGFILNVLIPNFYKNSHLDVSKDFLIDIDDLIKEKNFKEISSLADDIRRNYNSYIDREIEQVKIIGRNLIV